MTLSNKILLGMVAGVVLGSLLNAAFGQQLTPLLAWVLDSVFDLVGQVFIASLKVLVVPLVFVSLVVGTATISPGVSLGKIATKTIGFYLLTTALAITAAVIFANLIDPGTGLDRSFEGSFTAPLPPTVKEVLIDIFPTNPIAAMAEGNMLQIIVFALLVGVALAQVGTPGTAALRFFESINDVNMRMVTILMHLAPWGVFALLTTLFSAEGFGAIIALGKYFFTVVGVLLFHAVVVYPLLLLTLTRLNPLTLFKNIRPAALFGFSTASSNATLPITLGVVENRLGVNPSIGSFTVPLGATINMDGSAILQGVATVFIAQAYGIDIGLSGYLAVIATATLASIGTAGVPGAALIMLAMVLQQVGLPVEGIALIIGVDRLLDMIRTAVNITGDCVVSTVVAHSEGLLDRAVYDDVSDRDRY